MFVQAFVGVRVYIYASETEMKNLGGGGVNPPGYTPGFLYVVFMHVMSLFQIFIRLFFYNDSVCIISYGFKHRPFRECPVRFSKITIIINESRCHLMAVGLSTASTLFFYAYNSTGRQMCQHFASLHWLDRVNIYCHLTSQLMSLLRLCFKLVFLPFFTV